MPLPEERVVYQVALDLNQIKYCCISDVHIFRKPLRLILTSSMLRWLVDQGKVCRWVPDGRTVEAIEVKKTIRWLGVLFDRKMSFRAHVKEACCRASKVANGIKILAGCYKGAPTDSLLKAVRACVLPILTYGYQAWWPTGEKTHNDNDYRA